MSSQSWGEYIGGLALLFTATLFFFWGSSGIIKRELHWEDNSEQSIGAKGTVRGGFSVVLGILIILLGIFSLGVAIYFLSRLEWYPLSWVVFLRLSVLVLIIVPTIALGVSIYRGKVVRLLKWLDVDASHKIYKKIYSRKLRKRYKGKSAPLPYDPTWLVELAKEQIPEETEIINSLKLCTTIIGFDEYGDIYFIDPKSVERNPRDNIRLYKKNRWETEAWISVSTDKRIISIGEEP
jgi:ABC-type multidrug transport system fused ATPase/permease subunit